MGAEEGCTGGNGSGNGIASKTARCEDLCAENQSEISGSGCIEEFAAFNEAEDTIAVTPAPFDSPGPADPTKCRSANGNGIVIGKGDCDE